MESGDCQRVKKLRLAFKKTISETFKEKNAIMEILLSKKATGDDSLSFIGDNLEDENEDCTEYNTKAFEELFEKLRHVSYDAFRPG